MFIILMALATSPWYAGAEISYYNYQRPAAPFGENPGSFALPTYQMNPNFLPQMSFQMPYNHLNYRQPPYQSRQPSYQTSFNENAQMGVVKNFQQNEIRSENFNNFDNGAWRPIPSMGANAQQTVQHTSGTLISSQFGGTIPISTISSAQSATSVQSSAATVQRPAAAPIITKNIYFHIPPPDIEQPRVIPQPAPKKIYKIVFIKVPSHDAYGRTAAQTVHQQAAVEEKTLIYVLVNKPEPQKLPEPSKPEVFFVKYKGEVGKVMSQISGSLSPAPSGSSGPTNPVHRSNPQLQPGLVNGRQ